MNPLKKSIAVAVLSGGSVAALFAGSSFVRFGGNVAQAADNPKQGNVQAPVDVTPAERQQLDSLAGIFKKVSKSVEPSVVRIDVIKKIKAPRTDTNELFRRLFPDRDGDGQPDVPEGFKFRGDNGDGNDNGDDEPNEFQQMGTGSGVIMEVHGSDVYLLTNNHVAGGASEMRVELADGRFIEGGKTLGTDPKSDLAVVKIKADNCVAAPWGNSDQLEKGDWVMAFGSPFGYVGSMTHGIVSALNRRAGILGANGYENFIQVDAPINPGNSGGPLVNTRGEVIGINTAIASRSGGFQGIGFAIPSNQAKVVYTALKENGKMVRGYIGVSIQDASVQPEVTQSFGYKGHDGVLVRQTFKNTPAVGKLMPGDIITAIAGKSVKDSQELRNTVAATPPGTDLKMTVFRRGKTEDVTLKIGEQPEDLELAMLGGNARRSGEAAARVEEDAGSVMGMKLTTPNDKLAQEYALGTDNRQGALVTEVDPKSAAAKAGIRKGDVITRVVEEDVLNAKQATDAIKKADASKGVRLYVTNREGSRFVVITPNKKASE
jgi:serine protease Do